MIVYPKNWQDFGKPVTFEQIDNVMKKTIASIDCANLSFSGGLDSSLLLHYILETKGHAHCFTVANDIEHPDIEYSNKSIKWFEDKYRIHINHSVFIRQKLEGDMLVKSFYNILKTFVNCIIAGDCIDELSCGYYQHQDLSETTYQDYLNRLQAEHLVPLNENSGDIKVYLPYADNRIANLLYRVPLYEKVSTTCRKTVMMKLAEGKVNLEAIERKKYGFATSISVKTR